MKIAILNDTHFGCRNDSQLFLNNTFKFFSEVFFPYLKDNNIDTVLHLGDMMDRRKFVNFNTLSRVRKEFVERMEDSGIKFHCVIGNHDTYYKNTNELNSLRELFTDRYKNIHIYEHPVELEFDSFKIALVPWMAKENKDERLEFLKNTTATWVGGHFELDGYQVFRGIDFEGGMDDNFLSRFEEVMSGHFHIQSRRKNVHYIGTQYQLTFSDLGEKKGFWVLDTETRTKEFVENPHTMFHQLEYDDVNKDMKKFISSEDFSKYEDCFVRILVHNKNNSFLLDKMMDSLYSNGVQSVTVIEDIKTSDLSEEEQVDLSKDTLTLIRTEVDNFDMERSSKIKEKIQTLYMEALTI